jgi:hypothetical protein
VTSVPALFLLSGVLLAPQRAEPVPTSSQSAERVWQLLDRDALEAVAAEDPLEPGRFVAARKLPDRLLMVTARCAESRDLRVQLSLRAFREAYMAVQACALPATRLVVQDIGADGLHANLARTATPDIVSELVSRELVFDGDWRRHELELDTYLSVWRELDAQYHRLLRILIGELR